MLFLLKSTELSFIVPEPNDRKGILLLDLRLVMGLGGSDQTCSEGLQTQQGKEGGERENAFFHSPNVKGAPTLPRPRGRTEEGWPLPRSTSCLHD